MKPGRHDLGVIEDHQGSFRKQFRNIPEDIFIDLAVLIAEQFGCVALGEGIFRDALVGKIVIIVLNMY